MYSRPVEAPISDSWQEHKDRHPPSTEPGTDYACGVGTPVLAPADGFVVSVKPTTSGAPGRAILIKTGADYHRGNHLQRLDLQPGLRFVKGQQLALSGASANGSEHGVGAHLHWAFWREPGRVPTPGVTPTQDFEKYVTTGSGAGGGENPFEEDDMDANQAKQLDDLWQLLLPAIAGRKAEQGAVFKDIRSSRDNAIAARTAAEATLATLTRGQEGVKEPGEAYVLLKQAAAPLTQAEVDAIATAVVAKLPPGGGGSLAPGVLADAVADELARRLVE